MSHTGGGLVAAGNPDTAAAGIEALRLGGNAVDAAVAAMLAATVAEPLLTGLGGAGIATLRVDGVPQVYDLFTDMPGLGRDPEAPTAPLRAVDIDFGPTTQRFYAGPASVAVPSLPAGLCALHARLGRLPLSALVEPAARLAEQGAVIQPGLATVMQHLWPICAHSPSLVAWLGQPDGQPLRAGAVHRAPLLAATLRALGEQGAALFRQGPVVDAILQAVEPNGGRLTRRDLEQHQPLVYTPLRYRYRDATIWVPGPPSVAGLLVLQALRELEDHGPMPPAGSTEQVRRVAAALGRAERSRTRRMNRALFAPGFVEGFLTALAPDEEGEEWLYAPLTGHTTHISVADQDGNLVGITASLGETAGLMAEGTGVILNNFLGEDDVNPPGVHRAPGQRLMTMCCPTIIERDDGASFVLGSGGSSRIRSAILHGIINIVDHRMPPSQATHAPRAHVEAGVLRVESADREPGFTELLREEHPDLREFTDRNMFFGGLTVAGTDAAGFSGAGDVRRSGCVATF